MLCYAEFTVPVFFSNNNMSSLSANCPIMRKVHPLLPPFAPLFRKPSVMSQKKGTDTTPR